MAATARGGIMFFTAGKHAVKHGQMHLKRINVASTSSLFRAIQGSRNISFREAYPLPVNKFDLNCTGVLAASSAYFTTTPALQSQAEVVSESEDDIEVSKENRWPSPVIQQEGKINQIFFGGADIDLSEDVLTSTFSKFGTVKAVNIPLKEKYKNSTNRSYRYGFITFNDESSVRKAVEQGKIVTNDGLTIDIKSKTLKSATAMELERTAVIENLPADITVDGIYDKVKVYGEVELINVVFNESLQPNLMKTKRKGNYAYVVFGSVNELKRIIEVPPVFTEDAVIVAKTNTWRRQRRDRSKKVMIEQVPKDVNIDQIKGYLGSVGPVKSVIILTNGESGESRGMAIAEFLAEDDVQRLTNIENHNIGDAAVSVRALGAIYKT